MQDSDPAARVISGGRAEDDGRFDRIFRPTALDDFVGQAKHKDNLNRMKSAYDANKSPQKRKEISDGFDEMARAEVLDMEADDDEDEEK